MERLRLRTARASATPPARRRGPVTRGFGKRAVAALAAALFLSSLVLAAPAGAVEDIPLGSASTFAVLGASAVTNTGPSVITGDLGVSPGTSISGFPPGSVTGTVHNADTTSTAAQGDIGTAYAAAASQACDTDLSGQDLGGQTLPPAVYCFASSAQLTGVLRLDAQGSPTAKWLFKVTSALTTASDAAVILINGGTQCINQVNWQVGSSATVGSGTIFLGNILANTSITLATGSNSTGSLYAHTGAVTMDSNRVGTCDGGVEIPPPPPLGISTTPSGSVGVGGTISDSATVSGGLSPTGNVTFTLFGPTDPLCTGTPLSTTVGALVARTATSGDVVAATGGTYNWVAVYGGDANNGPATSPCGSEQVVVTSEVLTGRAFGLSAKVTLAGSTLVNVVTPDTGYVSTTQSSTTSTPCVASLTGIVRASVLCAKVTTVNLPAELDGDGIGRRQHGGGHGDTDGHAQGGPVVVDDNLRRVERLHHHRLPEGRQHCGDRLAHQHRPEHGDQRRHRVPEAQRADPVLDS